MDPTRDPAPCMPATPYRHVAARCDDDGLPPATVDQDVEEYFFE
ncbi:hypothetical protein GCM10008101_24060 [Lysobacter xinjiangensis]|uniref:Uncharacterized protein n=1 Tax=Cognatilysobacter xinjiangensis TaxID=546892 RepID=A0ABQ3C6B5_9GAMM|nr:hypothetical protein [Lysobacter xinjiangensis]GGZ68925.1 hypothetical protein GCM10008101_24060 [Lysobacter xinjiangensis]